MSVDELLKEFESAKKEINPVLESKKLVIPIFIFGIETEGHFVGDGFYYAPGKIHWKYGMTGHSEDATPENLLKAFKHYKDKEMGIEEALQLATYVFNTYKYLLAA